MHQGTQDWDWDTQWKRFALGLKPLDVDSKSQLQTSTQLLLLGIQCLAAQLAPEVKEKITQPDFGTTVLISGNLNTKLSTKAKGTAERQSKCAVISQPQIQNT